MSDTPEKPATLYEHDAQVQRLRQQMEQMLRETDGEITEEIDAFIENDLSQAEGQLREKLGNYAKYMRHLESVAKELRAEAQSIRAKVQPQQAALQNYVDEAERMEALADKVEDRRNSLAERLKWWMHKEGIKSVETDRFHIEIKGKGGKDPVEFDGPVPEQYQRHSFRVRWVPRELTQEQADELGEHLYAIREIINSAPHSDTRHRQSTLKSYIGECLDVGDEKAQQFAHREANVRIDIS